MQPVVILDGVVSAGPDILRKNQGCKWKLWKAHRIVRLSVGSTMQTQSPIEFSIILIVLTKSGHTLIQNFEK